MEYKDIPRNIKSLEEDISNLEYVQKLIISSGTKAVSIQGYTVHVDSVNLKAAIAESIKQNNIKLEALKESHETLTKVAKGLL